MAESRFIKTVAFGGYEKIGVIRKMEYLESQVHDLGNKLTEARLLLDAYKKGTDAEKAQETVLSNERARLTQVQVQNDTLTTKLKATEDENRGFAQEIKDLKASVAELQQQLKTANETITAMQAENEASAISNVFIEAQKSAAMLDESARAKAAALEENSKAAAQSVIEEANIEAEQIVYEANKSAQEIIADAKNQSEQMHAASNNLRASVLNEVKALKSDLTAVQNALKAFRENGSEKLTAAGQLLDQTETALEQDGVPVFKEPKHYEPQISEPPMRLSERLRENACTEEDKQKKQQELDKLKQMAESLGGNGINTTEDNTETSEPNEPDISDDSTEQSAAEPAKSDSKSGVLDLAALAAKANAIGKK